MLGPQPVRLLCAGDVIRTRDGDEAVVISVHVLAYTGHPARVEVSYFNTTEGVQSLDVAPDYELTLLRTAAQEYGAVA